jgi:hypothetical protein
VLLLDLLTDMGILRKKGGLYVRTKLNPEPALMEPWLTELHGLLRELFNKGLPKALGGYRQGVDGDDAEIKALYVAYMGSSVLNLARFLAISKLGLGNGTVLYLMPTVDNVLHYVIPRLRDRAILVDWHDELLESDLSIYKDQLMKRIIVIQGDLPRVNVKLREMGVGDVDHVLLVNVLQYVESSRRVLFLSSIRMITRYAWIVQCVYDNLVGKVINLFTYVLGSWLVPTLNELRSSLSTSGFVVSNFVDSEYGYVITAM